MIACPLVTGNEWKELVSKHGENYAYAIWNRNFGDLGNLKLVKPERSISIQKSNIKNVESGNKTISVRPSGHNYRVGDVVKVTSRGNDTGLRVEILSVRSVNNFNDLTTSEKDNFARSIGNYKDFKQFSESNEYAKEGTILSTMYPELNDFISGRIASDIITYHKVDKLMEGETSEDKKMIDLVNKVRTFIEKKILILEKKDIFNKAKKQNELKRLSELLSNLDGISSITEFISDAYDKTKEAELMFNDLIDNQDRFSKSELVARLNAFNEFVNGYNILDEINKTDLDFIRQSRKIGIQEDGDFGIHRKLAYVIERKDILRNNYINKGIPLLADFLLENKSQTVSDNIKKQIEELENSVEYWANKKDANPKVVARKIKQAKDIIAKIKPADLNRERLIEQLKLASKDENALSFLFDPLISSEDSVAALFARAIKNALEEARLINIKDAKGFKDAFDDFLKNNNKNRDNVADFNSDIYEIIDKKVFDDDGNEKILKQKSFVQKYDISNFKKKRDEFFKKIGKKPVLSDNPTKDEILALQDWSKSVAMWFKENTQPKSEQEIKSAFKSKNNELNRGIITKAEYDEWVNSVRTEFYNKESHQHEVSYKGELTEPSDKYINPKWSKLYSEDGVPINAAGRYHQFMLDKYLKDQSKLPEHFRKGYILPSIPKDNTERLITNGAKDLIKKKFSEAINVKAYDRQYGISSIEGDDVRYLPVHYTHFMDADDVSSDILESIITFSEMANKYQSLNKVNAEINLFQQVIGERQTIKMNSKGEKIIDALAAKMGYNDYIRKSGESYSKRHIDAFIDMVVYGKMQEKEEILGVDAGKIVDKLLNYSAITTIAADLVKGVANNIQGNIQVTIEANSGKHFNKKNLLQGSAFYIKNAKGMIADFGKISPDNIANKIIDLYDGIQGQYLDTYGKNVSGSIARKLFRTNTLFLNQHLAEHEIQMKTLFALLSANYVKDNKSGEQISILDAYEKYGINIENHTDFTETKRKDLMHVHHALAKRMHGVYNSFDRATIQRYSLGRLAIMYRKHLIPSYKKRFKGISVDQEEGGINEGFYITFFRTFGRDLLSLQLNLIKNWETYSDFEREQIKRTLAEAAFVVALMSTIFFLRKAADDDDDLKDSYLYNFILYQAIRNKSETASYYPLNYKDAYRVIKSPSAMTTTIDRLFKFIDQSVLTWDPDKLNYKRKSGAFDAGDNKSWAYFLRLAGLSSYNIHPEEAIKSFEGSLNK